MKKIFFIFVLIGIGINSFAQVKELAAEKGKFDKIKPFKTDKVLISRGNGTYSGKIIILDVDAHSPIDRYGSKNEYTD